MEECARSMNSEVIKSGPWVWWMHFGMGPEIDRLPKATPVRTPVYAHVHWGDQAVGEVNAKHEIYMEIGFYEYGSSITAEAAGGEGNEGRHELYSISVGGFAGEGSFYSPTEEDPPRKELEILPAQKNSENGTILILGQRPTDQALAGYDYGQWLQEMFEFYGHSNIVLRKHPTFALPKSAVESGVTTTNLTGDVPLHKDVWQYNPELVLTFSSSAAIKTHAWGYNTLCWHERGLVHDTDTMDTREDWMRKLSYRVWTKDEINRGRFRPYLHKYLEEIDNAG